MIELALRQLAEQWRLKASYIQGKYTTDKGQIPQNVVEVVAAIETCAEELETMLPTPKV